MRVSRPLLYTLRRYQTAVPAVVCLDDIFSENGVWMRWKKSPGVRSPVYSPHVNQPQPTTTLRFRFLILMMTTTPAVRSPLILKDGQRTMSSYWFRSTLFAKRRNTLLTLALPVVGWVDESHSDLQTPSALCFFLEHTMAPLLLSPPRPKFCSPMEFWMVLRPPMATLRRPTVSRAFSFLTRNQRTYRFP